MTERETKPLLPEENPAAEEMPVADHEQPSSDDKLWAGLSYISQFIVPVIVPVILLIAETNRKSPFQKYHGVHSLALFAVSVIYEIAAVVVYSILTAISAGCFGCILWPVFLVPVVVFIYYGYLAFSGEYFEVPYLTSYLREQDWV